MIKIENTDVYGFEAAIRGMRNPKESWDKSDSGWSEYSCGNSSYDYEVGDKDLKLMKTLAKAGPDHGKYLRMITVSCDITAPVYWIAELDTYKVATVRDSCSMMHKGTSKKYTAEAFSTNMSEYGPLVSIWEQTIDIINTLADKYNETHNIDYFLQMRALMPMGYNYRFTWMANYQVLREIYHARKNHRLPEWHTFCEWIESLPYSELITE